MRNELADVDGAIRKRKGSGGGAARGNRRTDEVRARARETAERYASRAFASVPAHDGSFAELVSRRLRRRTPSQIVRAIPHKEECSHGRTIRGVKHLSGRVASG